MVTNKKRKHITTNFLDHLKKFKVTYYLLGCAALLYSIGQSWITSFFYVPEPPEWVYLHGFKFPDYAAWVVLILIGASWLVHGVQFALIKR